ncbi:MAG: alpha-E domain-containing protein, partial [Rhizobacter sp.]|nr:alpha-E domain-containing protein [Chlorobiales bacterium]
AEKRLGRLRSKLDYTDIAEIMSQGLHEFLDDFQSELNDAGEGIFDTFFALRPAPESSEQVHSKS